MPSFWPSRAVRSETSGLISEVVSVVVPCRPVLEHESGAVRTGDVVSIRSQIEKGCLRIQRIRILGCITALDAQTTCGRA